MEAIPRAITNMFKCIALSLHTIFYSSTFFNEFSPLQGYSSLKFFVQPPPSHCYAAHPHQLSCVIFPILYFILSIFSPCLHWLCPVLHRAATTALRLGHELHVARMGILPVWTQCPKNPTCPWEQLAWIKLCTIWPFPELLHTLDTGQLSLPPSLSPPHHQPVTWQFPFLSPCKSFLQFLPFFLHWVLYFSVFLILFLQADSTFPPWITLIYDILVKNFFWWYYFL